MRVLLFGMSLFTVSYFPEHKREEKLLVWVFTMNIGLGKLYYCQCLVILYILSAFCITALFFNILLSLA